MYKRRLLISEDEKRHIKGLYGLIQETTLPGQTLKVEFGDQYADGKYLIKNKDLFKQKLDKELLDFTKKNPGVPLSIRVLGGESATTNYDYETNDGVSKEDFYLAKKRRDEMINFLKEYFETSTIEPKPTLDDSPNEENINVFRKGLTQKDRFVDVLITAQAPGTCLIGLKIEVIYEKDGKSDKFPCRGRHTCDEAVFNVLLNDVVIGEVNLNNKADGGSRNGTVEVTEAQAIEIAKKGKPNVRLSLQCLLSNCHKDVAEIRITNSTGVIYHSCTPVLGSRGAGVNDLLVLDKCGTKILLKNTKEVSTSGTVEVKSEMGTAVLDPLVKSGTLKKLDNGDYEVNKPLIIKDKKYKVGDIIPKPSF